ncbi:MAG: DUF342 domain-containing protein [Lachnospiraceae bacterium]|nr:DUF342 domain-containing protein [Lachnospiraceae bacterium]
MNGYFRLKSIENGFGLELIPPSNGGEPINIAEVMDYLGSQSLVYDLSVLKEKIESGERTEYFLRAGACPVLAESYKLIVAEDNMSAIARFYPATEGGKQLSVEEFVKDLRFRNIIYGLQIQNMQEYFAEREYCKDILVAKGKEVIQGKNAYIEYLFNTDVHARPTVREDGSVDFFNLNAINHCSKGQVLARIIPEEKGHHGRNILGERFEAIAVKPTVFRYGRNIQVSEDRLSLISMVDGHVALVDDKVFVSDVYEVENVDNATGNIEYEGSVQINGNVISNFSVTAKGNVIVNGVVEGATITAGGNIIIARGMNGMTKGKLVAGGNIIAKFLENATAEADGYIQTESILHSNVMAGAYIEVNGKRGFITGGHVVAAEKLIVKTLGAQLGAPTIVEVGVNPKIKEEYQQLQKDIGEIQKVLSSTRSILSSYSEKTKKGAKFNEQQMKYYKSVILLDTNKKKELELKMEKLEKIQESLNVQHKAYVEVSGQVYAGTKVIIGDLSMVVQNSFKSCRFEKVQGNVKCIGI